jgi:hypothetical protein
MSPLKLPLPRVRLALSLSAVLGCAGETSSGPSLAIDELFLSVSTQEGEEGRQLMVVGETGFATVIAFRQSIGADPGRVTFTVPDPGILRIQSTSGTEATITAVALGSVRISASAQGQSDETRVDLVATPLPVDRIQVRLAPISAGVEASYDSVGGLAGITLETDESAALELRVEREGVRVTQIPFELTSSQPGIALVNQHCRPQALDSQCDVFGTWG